MLHAAQSGSGLLARAQTNGDHAHKQLVGHVDPHIQEVVTLQACQFVPAKGLSRRLVTRTISHDTQHSWLLCTAGAVPAGRPSSKDYDQGNKQSLLSIHPVACRVQEVPDSAVNRLRLQHQSMVQRQVCHHHKAAAARLPQHGPCSPTTPYRTPFRMPPIYPLGTLTQHPLSISMLKWALARTIGSKTRAAGSKGSSRTPGRKGRARAAGSKGRARALGSKGRARALGSRASPPDQAVTASPWTQLSWRRT